MAYNVAILGATGAVGREIISILEDRRFPIKNLKLLSSERSAGTFLNFNQSKIEVEAVDNESFLDIDIAIFSAGGSISKIWAPIAVKAGAIVIDNSNAWRMEDGVPLVVPEVNPSAISKHKGIIANPNCSTIQLVLALNPIYKKFGLNRIVVSTYQAVSGSGNKAILELENQLNAIKDGKDVECKVYSHQIAFNCIPHIDVFNNNGYSKEEIKMIEETHKILEDNSIAVNATTVRVPIFRGHSESVYIETKEPVSAEEIRKLLSWQPGLEIMDDPENNIYPTALLCEKRDSVFVGRIRQDLFSPKGISLWIVSDNLRKGAALNAVQIGELLIS